MRGVLQDIAVHENSSIYTDVATVLTWNKVVMVFKLARLSCTFLKSYNAKLPVGVAVPENESVIANQREAPKLHLFISSRFRPPSGHA